MMKRTFIWDDAPHPVVTRHICYGGVDIGSIVETALPIITSFVAPELTPFVLGGEALFNTGRGIAEGRPFGQIAGQLGMEAAGAAIGGQFGDFGLGGGTPLDPSTFPSTSGVDAIIAAGETPITSSSGQVLGEVGAGQDPFRAAALLSQEGTGMSGGSPVYDASGNLVGYSGGGDVGLIDVPSSWSDAATAALPFVDAAAPTGVPPIGDAAAAVPPPTPIDPGVLGTFPGEAAPGAGASDTSALTGGAAGVGTATPGAAAGSASPAAGLSPAASADPFGISGSAGGAPGVGDLPGLPTGVENLTQAEGLGLPPPLAPRSMRKSQTGRPWAAAAQAASVMSGV